MYILEKLWRGEISPNEKVIEHGSKYEMLLKDLCKKEESLLKGLSSEQKIAYADLQSLRYEMQDIEAQEIFCEAFRIGAKLMLDVLSDDHENFKAIAE